MIYYNQVKGSKRKQKTGCTPTKVSNLSQLQDKFSLTIDIFYYIHFFRKVNENPKTKSNNPYPVKWSANRIATKAKQQEIANEVREKIIDLLKFPQPNGKT